MLWLRLEAGEKPVSHDGYSITFDYLDIPVWRRMAFAVAVMGLTWMRKVD